MSTSSGANVPADSRKSRLPDNGNSAGRGRRTLGRVIAAVLVIGSITAGGLVATSDSATPDITAGSPAAVPTHIFRATCLDDHANFTGHNEISVRQSGDSWEVTSVRYRFSTSLGVRDRNNQNVTAGGRSYDSTDDLVNDGRWHVSNDALDGTRLGEHAGITFVDIFDEPDVADSSCTTDTITLPTFSPAGAPGYHCERSERIAYPVPHRPYTPCQLAGHPTLATNTRHCVGTGECPAQLDRRGGPRSDAERAYRRARRYWFPSYRGVVYETIRMVGGGTEISYAFDAGGILTDKPRALPRYFEYREYDMYPHAIGEERGPGRIIVAFRHGLPAGPAWFTTDHYRHMTRLKDARKEWDG